MSEQSERNKTLVLEYMAAFRTFDPDLYSRTSPKNPSTWRA